MKKLYILILIFCFTKIIIAQIPGTLDLSFGNNGITLSDYSFNGNSNYAYASALQADGKIVLGGYSLVNGAKNMTFMRYYSNGTLDDNFASDGIQVLQYGGSDDEIKDIAVQTDGKIIAVGYTTNSTNTRIAIARLNSDGSLDNGFNGSGMKIIDFGSSIDAFGLSVNLMDNGNIIIAGYIRNDVLNYDAIICMLDPFGAMDNSFGTNGIMSHNILSQMNFMSEIGIHDNKIILGGMSFDDDFFGYVTLARYHFDGTLDTGFGTSGIVSVQLDEQMIAGPDGDMCISEDGKIIYACTSSEYPGYDIAVLRFNSDGSIDNYFGNNGLVITSLENNSAARAVAVQEDDKIIVGGIYHNESGSDFILLRYLASGFLDPSFGADGNGVVITNASIGSVFYDDTIYSLFFQSDGKVVVSGHAKTEDTGMDFAVARYHTGYHVGVDQHIQEEWELSITPNPFSSETKLVFNLTEQKNIDIDVFNSLGAKVASPINSVFQPGKHELSWDGNDLSPGIYFLKMTVGDKIFTKKMIKNN